MTWYGVVADVGLQLTPNQPDAHGSLPEAYADHPVFSRQLGPLVLMYKSTKLCRSVVGSCVLTQAPQPDWEYWPGGQASSDGSVDPAGQ